MNPLSHLRLRTKLGLLMGMSALALIVLIAVSASLMRQRMIDDRIDKLRAVVVSAMGFAQALQAEVDAHRVTQEQALATFRNQVHRVRFGAADEYLLLQTVDGMVTMHGGDPAREGKPTVSKDANGRSTAELARAVFTTGNGGAIWYLALKPGQAVPQAKVSYVAKFAPWQMVFIAGAWVDDVGVVARASLRRLSAIGGGILLITLLVAWLVNGNITRPLQGLKTAMTQLATGRLQTTIPGIGRRDEVGAMADAVLVFRDRMIKAEELTAEQTRQRSRSEAEKRTSLLHMAETVETETAVSLGRIRERTVTMTGTADQMGASAVRTGAAAETAAAAAAQALSNAQTVAGAAEELTASIREIGGQVDQSARVVSRAVTAGGGDARDDRGVEPGGGADRHRRRHDPRYRREDQPAGPECHDRSRSGGRGRQGLCRRGG
ncbi:MAG TPA: cache domain-containing protein [Rhodopila sp.]